MEIQHTIPVAEMNAEVAAKAVSFWKMRGATLQQQSDGSLVGQRGSLWHDIYCSPLVPFTPIRTAFVQISISPTSHGITCTTCIDGRIRPVLPQDRKYLELELSTFETFLLADDLQPEAWKAYRRDSHGHVRRYLKSALQNNMDRKRPRIIGGDLRVTAILLLAIGLPLSPLWLIWGPRLKPLLDRPNGRSPHPLDEFAKIMFGPVASGLWIVMFACVAMWLHVLRRRIATCVTADRAAEQLGIAPNVLKQHLEWSKVQPKYIVNSEPVYSLDDITGAATLLRAVDTGDSTFLLHPASAAPPVGPTTNVRPAAAPDAVEQNLSLSADEQP